MTFSDFQKEVLSQVLDFLYIVYILTSPSARNREKSVLGGPFLKADPQFVDGKVNAVKLCMF